MSFDRPDVRFLSNGARLHLQHGPIDLIIGADGERHAAFIEAQRTFGPILAELAGDLINLKAQLTLDVDLPIGETALRMHKAALPFVDVFLSRMICVAGAVADTVLAGMISQNIHRAYVNNGGDIALFLKPGFSFDMAIADQEGTRLGTISVDANDGVGGIATSGRHGRSLSLGIADAVTVLAKDAATADAAATLIANAVDLPDSDAIDRMIATEIDPNSDLGQRNVVVKCRKLRDAEIRRALESGFKEAQRYKSEGKIIDAALFLQGRSMILGDGCLKAAEEKRIEAHV
jgi:ApbE superfamily uncharacterized protein (UPF0280 family)